MKYSSTAASSGETPLILNAIFLSIKPKPFLGDLKMKAILAFHIFGPSHLQQWPSFAT